MCSYSTMNHFLKLQHSSCPHRPAGAWNAVTKGERSSFFCLTIGYNKIIVIWLASYSDQRIVFIIREKGLKWRRGRTGGQNLETWDRQKGTGCNYRGSVVGADVHDLWAVASSLWICGEDAILGRVQYLLLTEPGILQTQSKWDRQQLSEYMMV